MKTELYNRHANGQIRYWSIESTGDGLLISHGMLNGALQHKFEEIPCGKVNRTQEQQIALQYYSRISKQKDKGYVDDLEHAIANKATNTLGLPKPMLAQTYEVGANLNFESGIYVQRKYDGNRCIIHNKGGKFIAYSRNGKPIGTISHITDNMHIPVGMFVDGELYAHGYKLQTIVSWIKREQEDTLKLRYHAYDMIMPIPFSQRFNIMSKNVFGDCVEIAETYAVANREAVFNYHNRFRSEGYEGSIIRTNISGYEDGRRSKTLIKLKDWQDEEFLVTSIDASKDGWALLVCAQKEGPNFRVVAPGSNAQKAETYLKRDQYIGKRITVEFAYRTEDGVPFHPVAKAWR